MMDENRFFKFIWRFNGLIIMLICIVIIAVASYNIFVSFWIKNHGEDLITNVADDPNSEEKWQLGFPENIDGTSFVLIPLISEKEYVELKGMGLLASKEAYGRSHPTKNILFIDGKSNKQNWLYPTNDQLIVQFKLLSKESEYADNRKVIAIMYEVIKKDTNNDNRLTEDDLALLALSNVDGSNYTDIIVEADKINGVTTINENQVLIIYQREGIAYSATVSLRDFSTITNNKLPKVQKASSD